jgi:hypothetical protein
MRTHVTAMRKYITLYFFCMPKRITNQPESMQGKGQKTMFPRTGRPRPSRFLWPAHKEELEGVSKKVCKFKAQEK